MPPKKRNRERVKGSWRDKGKGECFTRTNKNGGKYVVCNDPPRGSKGQAEVYERRGNKSSRMAQELQKNKQLQKDKEKREKRQAEAREERRKRSEEIKKEKEAVAKRRKEREKRKKEKEKKEKKKKSSKK